MTETVLFRLGDTAVAITGWGWLALVALGLLIVCAWTFR